MASRPDADKRIRDLVEDLTPPGRGDFLQSVWTSLESLELQSKRRWRALAATAAVFALAATAAAGVLASQGDSATLDVSLICRPQIRGFTIATNANMPARTIPGSKPTPAQVSIATGVRSGQGTLLAFDAAHSGELINRSICKPTSAFPLTHLRLPAAGTYRGGTYSSVVIGCFLRGTFTMRAKITHDDSGIPTSATIALRMAKPVTPVVYLKWSPDLVTTFVSKRCS